MVRLRFVIDSLNYVAHSNVLQVPQQGVTDHDRARMNGLPVEATIRKANTHVSCPCHGLDIFLRLLPPTPTSLTRSLIYSRFTLKPDRRLFFLLGKCHYL